MSGWTDGNDITPGNPPPNPPPTPGGGGGAAGPQTYVPEAWDLQNCQYIVQSGDTPVALATFAKILNYQGGASPIHGINMFNPPAGVTDSKGLTDPSKWYPGARINMPPEACDYVASLSCPAGYQKAADGKSCELIPAGGGGGSIIPASIHALTTGQKLAIGVAVGAVVVGGGTLIWWKYRTPKRKNPSRKKRGKN